MITDIKDNLKIYYPLEFIPRKQQIDMFEMTKHSINRGKKFILMNAPTGSGKSYYTMMLANWYKNYVNSNAKFDIITNSKILQKQYIDNFPFIKSLKGMSNYYCNHHNTDCSEGKEINRILKRICTECPYDYDKRIWLESDITVTNFALYISMLLYTENIKNKNSNVLIIDESHDFESIFCDFISTKLNKNVFKKCGFNQIIQIKYNNLLKRIKNTEQFIDFIELTFLNDLQKLEEKLSDDVKTETENNIRTLKRKQFLYCTKLIEKLDKLILNYKDNNKNWSLDTNIKDDEIDLNLQPIWGYPYLNKILWDNYDHVIFMSGTILDKKIFSYINGLDENLTTYIDMDSMFNVEKRPLYYIKVGKMTFNDKEKTFNNQIILINKILKKYKNNKGIIHTVNYELSNWIKENISNDRLIFHDPENRDEKYDEFINSVDPKVMVSPSMMTGIDLKNDLARFSIIIKIPFPNISSNKIKSRQNNNKDWYVFKTCSDLIQAYGRTIRSEDDYSDTFILDESFSNILKYNSKYLPKYFTNAIKILK